MRSRLPLLRSATLDRARAIAALAAACTVTTVTPALGGVPSGFSLVPVATGLDEPTAHAYAPDGRVFVAERAGRVIVQQPGRDDSRSVFLDIRAAVNSNSERGLLGIALDPQFATRPRVFLFLTAERNLAAPDGAGEMDIEVWRYTASASETGVALPASKAVVVSGPRTGACCHYGGTVRFDSRGRLLTAFGDITDQPSSQRAGALTGRLIRIDPETGLGVADNPFYEPASPGSVASRTLATGFRNPFRFTVDPSDDSVWVGDVGQSSWEEIDRVPASGWAVPARDTNFGWPCFEGGSGTPLLTASAFSNSSWSAMCAPLATSAQGGTGPGTAPAIYAYPHISGQGASITGGPVLRGQSFPASYSGRALIADYSRDTFMTVGRDGSSEPFGTPGGFGNAVDIAMDPNGDASYAAIGAGAVRAIVWTAGNTPPSLTGLTAEAVTDAAPRTMRFVASATDPDSDPLTYRWDLGDTTVVAGPQLTHTYTTPISTDVAVTVSDGRRGGVARGTVHVDVGNTAPTVRLTHDAPTGGFRVERPLRLSIRADDAEEGALSGDALTWRATRIHLDHRHPLDAGTGSTGSFQVTDHGDDPSHLELVARATDRYGAISEATVVLHPQRVRMSVSGGPTGTPLVLDGTRVESPHFWDSIIGGRHEVSAPAEAGGLAFGWWQLDTTRWGDRTLAFTTPAVPAHAAAAFGPQPEPRRPDSASTPSAARTPLRATFRREGAWLVVRARAGRTGRVSIVISAAGRQLGSCRRIPVRANGSVRCRVRVARALTRTVQPRATVALSVGTGRHTLRLKLAPTR